MTCLTTSNDYQAQPDEDSKVNDFLDIVAVGGLVIMAVLLMPIIWRSPNIKK